jgi:hypothetical protein
LELKIEKLFAAIGVSKIKWITGREWLNFYSRPFFRITISMDPQLVALDFGIKALDDHIELLTAQRQDLMDSRHQLRLLQQQQQQQQQQSQLHCIWTMKKSSRLNGTNRHLVRLLPFMNSLIQETRRRESKGNSVHA